MARTKAALGSGARLADYLSASLLARVVPPAVVHEVLDAHDCNSQRVRSFPAVAGVYYCMRSACTQKPYMDAPGLPSSQFMTAGR